MIPLKDWELVVYSE